MVVHYAHTWVSLVSVKFADWVATTFTVLKGSHKPMVYTSRSFNMCLYSLNISCYSTVKVTVLRPRHPYIESVPIIVTFFSGWLVVVVEDSAQGG